MKRIRELLPDTDKGRTLLAGIVLLAAGLFLTAPPLALVVLGALLIVLSYLTPPDPEREP